MGASIDYYFSVFSSFAYLGDAAFHRLAEATGARIVYKPMDIMRVFAASETTPPIKQSEARRRNRENELKRWAERRGVPINLKPKHWPVPAAPASCAVLAAQGLGLDAGALSSAFLRAVWTEDEDISDAQTIERIVTKAFQADAVRVLATADERATADLFEATTNEAIAAGVFGSPTFVINGELFFGQDRLDFVAERLRVNS